MSAHADLLIAQIQEPVGSPPPVNQAPVDEPEKLIAATIAAQEMARFSLIPGQLISGQQNLGGAPPPAAQETAAEREAQLTEVIQNIF